MDKRNYIIWFIDLISTVVIAILVDLHKWIWLLIPILVALATKGYEYCASFQDKYDVIHAQLELLWKLVPENEKEHARCTYHVPIFRGKWFLQAFGYIPSGIGGGRLLPTNKGIIGKALRAKKVLYENFSNDADYQTRMVKEYRFTQKEIEELTPDRYSYFCSPVLDSINNKVIGVFYFDAHESGTFSEGSDSVLMEAILRACKLIKETLV